MNFSQGKFGLDGLHIILIYLLLFFNSIVIIVQFLQLIYLLDRFLFEMLWFSQKVVLGNWPIFWVANFLRYWIELIRIQYALSLLPNLFDVVFVLWLLWLTNGQHLLRTHFSLTHFLVHGFHFLEILIS